MLEVARKNKCSEDLPDHFEVDNTVISNPNQIANEFNDFFFNVASKLDANIPATTSDPLAFLGHIHPPEPFLFHEISTVTVHNIISGLNNCGAGVDGVSTKILKLISSCILPHLTHLFNLCLLQGIFPTSFKQAIVVPIFKRKPLHF